MVHMAHMALVAILVVGALILVVVVILAGEILDELVGEIGDIGVDIGHIMIMIMTITHTVPTTLHTHGVIHSLNPWTVPNQPQTGFLSSSSSSLSPFFFGPCYPKKREQNNLIHSKCIKLCQSLSE
jgi:hypothetical protein